MKDRIEIDDHVTVRLNNGNQFRGIVKYMPQDTGDAWIIVETDLGWTRIGVTHCVQTYAEIVRHDYSNLKSSGFDPWKKYDGNGRLLKPL